MKNNEENFGASNANADEVVANPDVAEWAVEINKDDNLLTDSSVIVEEMKQQADNADDIAAKLNAIHAGGAEQSATAFEEENVKNEEAPEVIVEELIQEPKRPVFDKPDFASGFRGYKKEAVDAFILQVLKVYNDIAKEQNYDLGLLEDAAKKIKAQENKIANLEAKIVKQDKNSEAALTAKLVKKGEEITLKAKSEAEKIIQKAHVEADKVKAKAEADHSKAKASYAKIEKSGQVKAEAIIAKAEKAAKDVIAKANKEAANILAKGKKEIDDAKRVMSKQKDINDRLVAFYTTQIKTLKAENKKFNK
jgi:cell division septum initiation protein DivIVA